MRWARHARAISRNVRFNYRGRAAAASRPKSRGHVLCEAKQHTLVPEPKIPAFCSPDGALSPEGQQVADPLGGRRKVLFDWLRDE